MRGRRQLRGRAWTRAPFFLTPPRDCRRGGPRSGFSPHPKSDLITVKLPLFS